MTQAHDLESKGVVISGNIKRTTELYTTINGVITQVADLATMRPLTDEEKKHGVSGEGFNDIKLRRGRRLGLIK